MALLLKDENLYANGYVINLADGRSLLKRDRLVYNPLANKDRTHILIEGDRPWLVANKYYGDDKRWHIPMDVNRIFDPFDLPVGFELIIPDLDVIKAGQ